MSKSFKTITAFCLALTAFFMTILCQSPALAYLDDGTRALTNTFTYAEVQVPNIPQQPEEPSVIPDNPQLPDQSNPGTGSGSSSTTSSAVTEQTAPSKTQSTQTSTALKTGAWDLFVIALLGIALLLIWKPKKNKSSEN